MKIKELIDDLKIDAGLQILGVRLDKDMTQEELAKMIGTTQSGIARNERGRVMTNLETFAKIAFATNSTLIPPQLISTSQGVSFDSRNVTTFESSLSPNPTEK